jgi:tetratricopeptide (TPR) repeat protein
LLHLVNKSLVLVDEQSDETRYRLLETLREYARDRLLESGEADTIRQQHLAFFLQYAEIDEPGPQADELPYWCKRLEGELDNLRMVLAWSLQNNVAAGLRLAGVMGHFSFGASLHLREGSEWLRKFRALPEISSSYALEKAKVLLWAGAMQHEVALVDQADPRSLLQQGRVWLEESLAIYQEFGYPLGVADSFYELGRVIFEQGNLEVARKFFTDSARISQEAGDKIRAARALNVLGVVFDTQGDRTQAPRLIEEALRIYRESGLRSAANWPLANLGDMALEEGDLASAFVSWHWWLTFRVTMGRLTSCIGRA